VSAEPTEQAQGRRTAAVLLGVVGVAAVLAISVFGGHGDDVGEMAAPAAAAAVSGGALPRLENPAADPAVGMAAPRVEGADFDGTPVTAPADDGRPTVLVFLAHWCPACQDEVPRVQGWIDAGAQPDDVALIAVSTGVNPGRDNYPPAAWLEAEGWTVPTIVDGDDSLVQQAYGLPAYPYWVFIGADGTVLGRHAGALSIAELERVMARLQELS
jgi:cytochrome c biogenesis protein CcmG, thiol:disulfide interchange protein DsbE